MKLVVCAGLLFLTSVVQAAISPQEREALIAFYEAMGGDQWRDNFGWKTPEGEFSPPGTEHLWTGVTLNGERTHVIKLFYSFNNMVGTFPDELEQLTKLEEVFLIRAKVEEFPIVLTRIPSLLSLNLFQNQIPGTIPPEIGNMTGVQQLSLDGNLLGGVLPVELANLTQLRRLSICNNQFTQLPNLSTLSNLQYLDLCRNQFKGEVPAWFFEMETLQYLNLSENRFNGTFPVEASLVQRQFRLFLANNQIESFPVANWNQGLVIDLRYNELQSSSCEAIKKALDDGVELSFIEQTSAELECDVFELVQVLPWVADDNEEWRSDVQIMNTGTLPALVSVERSNGLPRRTLWLDGGAVEKLQRVTHGRGYALKIYSHRRGIRAGYQIAGLGSPSGESPAITLGLSPDQGAAKLFYPVLPGNLTAALSLIAPEAEGVTPVRLRLFTANGLVGESELVLQSGEPQGFLVSSYFGDVAQGLDVALEVEALDGTALFGSAFAFNSLNEPSVTQARPWHEARARLLFPWMASGEQWLSYLAIFNPSEQPVSVTLTAVTTQGQTEIVTRSIAGKRLVNWETGTLFPDLQGYSLSLESREEGSNQQTAIFASLQVANKQARATTPSPAMTSPILPETASGVANIPYASTEGNPALVIQAPNATGLTEVAVYQQVTQFAFNPKIITLEKNQPKALLLNELLSGSFSQLAYGLRVVSLSGEPICATYFNFNDQREPAMAQSEQVAYFDLGVSLQKGNSCTQSDETTISIVNNGPFQAPEDVHIEVEADGQVIDTLILEEGLAPDQQWRRAISGGSQGVKLTARLILPGYLEDQNPQNNVAELTSNPSILLARGARLRPTTQGLLAGLLFAEEETITLKLGRFSGGCEQEVSFYLEQLRLEKQGEYESPRFQLEPKWQKAPTAQVEWLKESNELRISGLQNGDVYRLQAELRRGDQEPLLFSDLCHLSKSNYTSDQFGAPFGKNAETLPMRVINPFYTGNWHLSSLNGIGVWTSASTYQGDLRNSLGRIFRTFRVLQSSEGLGKYVLELPGGIYDLAANSFKVNNESGAAQFSFELRGAGPEKTLLINRQFTPELSPQQHRLGHVPRWLFESLDRVRMRDFAFWGAKPPQEQGRGEVSGRQVLTADGTYRYPYEWFSVGIFVKNSMNIHIENIDFRFHGIGVDIEHNFNEQATSERQVKIENSRFAYADAGVYLRNVMDAELADLDIFHVSRQGIFANGVNRMVIQNNRINGARQRGINLDRTFQVLIDQNEVLHSGQTGIHFGGSVHQAAVINNLIQTVDRDRINPFGDTNLVNGTVMAYRPIYEGIKTVRGQWGDSSSLYFANNVIRDVADGISVIQGNANEVVIENNTIEAWRRGVRLEFGASRLLVENGIYYDSLLTNLFIAPTNSISLTHPLAEDNPSRHGLFFSGYDPNCPACNIGFLDSYGQDQGKEIAYYPFPIEFTNDDNCSNPDPGEPCGVLQSNSATVNLGPVYLPPADSNSYYHPNARYMLWDSQAAQRAEQIRKTVLEPFNR